MNMPLSERRWSEPMGRALDLARQAARAGDVPVGAVVLDAEGSIIGTGYNQRQAAHDPTAHAEIIAIRQAGGAAETWNLSGHTLVVTVEPCTMCAGAVVAARLGRLVFGAWEPKTGAVGSVRDVVRDPRIGTAIEVIGGVRAEESQALLREFFARRR